MLANQPSAKGAAVSASPSSSAAVNSWPLAWKMRPSVIRPIWLIFPSAGISSTDGSASAVRAPGLSARVKKALKLG